MKRTRKNGTKIIAEVKSFLVTTKVEVKSGTLNKRGLDAKMFAEVVPNRIIAEGTKVCLRFGIRKFNGNFLVYAHSFGWIEVSNMEETFISKDTEFSTLLQRDYMKLTNEEKIKALSIHFPTSVSNLTKTETLLMGLINGKDLNEVEKEIAADKSLKYKVKKHTDEYATTFIKKLEATIA